ncbi:GAF domain-containing protein [Geobacter sp. DSM 9736]|uniref:GAF domain-containing protein n=1 Tax=Geobacter sp. DSM 9736 TaxID=1277350 RepID=UPI000B5051EB|nr:GAF domain-containing protein [Geobacter sp. DSM 9736]SNB47636.1 GAF sensor signal transduction histidine kinase [Geobacter sp. DSM 9736]
MAVQDRYNLLSRVVRIANSARLSYPARLKSLVEFLSQYFQFPSLSLYILDKEHRYLVNKVTSGFPRSVADCRIPLGEGIAGRCAGESTLLIMAESQSHEDESRHGDPLVAAVPVREEGVLWGVLTFGLQSAAEFRDEDVEALQDALVVMAGLIHGVRNAENSDSRIRNLTTLNQLGQLLNRSIPLPSLVPLVLDTCCEFTEACCIVLRLLPESGMPAGSYRKCSRGISQLLPSLLDIEEAASRRVVNDMVPLLVCDIIDEADLPPSYVTVPLKFEEKMLGTLTFFGKRQEHRQYVNYDEEDRELLESIGMLISNAFAGATHYQQLVSLSEENEKKLKEGFLLYRISNTMLSTIRLNKLIHLILTALTSGLNPFFDRAMLFLINERAGIMQGMLGVTRETAQGLLNPVSDLEDIQASRWDISEEAMAWQRDSEFSSLVRASRLELNRALNVASRAVLDKKPIFVPDVTKEKRVDRDFIQRFSIKSFAVAPLMAKDQVVGVVIVDNALGGREISRDDLRFLQLFTNQAGMAIENSMLYNRIEDTNRNLREAQERLIQGERLATIGEMAAGIAHELKSPLVSIGGFARRLERKLPAGSVELEYADTIVREVQRLEKMLNDILSFTKKTTICYTHCNITDIIEECLAIVAMAFEEFNIKVIKQYPRRVIVFLGDCQQLKQVFLNLFINAQEAMKSGGTLKISVSSATLNGASAVSVKITDSGGGIALEALHNIFNPFYTTKETGTGLGLPIANRIVTNHGGKIQVNNKVGIGVEFNIILPRNI